MSQNYSLILLVSERRFSFERTDNIVPNLGPNMKFLLPTSFKILT